MPDDNYPKDAADYAQRERSPKRQRTVNGYVDSPGYSSAEEQPAHREQDGTSYNLTERPAPHLDRGNHNVTRDPEAYAEAVDGAFSANQYRRDPRSRSGSSGLKAEEDATPYSAGPGSPAPLKPTRLHYKPKLVLRGHRKGVAQVKFSPDGRWIASCCRRAPSRAAHGI